MIVVTGASGFIGSAYIEYLKKNTSEEVYCFDLNNINELLKNIFFYNTCTLVHLGAVSDTMCKEPEKIYSCNIDCFEKLLSNWKGKVIFASSASVHGNSSGFEPLNNYAFSKFCNEMYSKELKKGVGLRFFNVYGKNEGKKGKTASMVYQILNDVLKNKCVWLFEDGKQERDFVYVGDVIKVIEFFRNSNVEHGVFDVGTGKSISFLEVVFCISHVLNKKVKFKFMDFNKKLVNRYQFKTRANLSALRKIGYKEKFLTLEEGIKEMMK